MSKNKMSKSEKDYLDRKMQGEVAKAKQAFAKEHPTTWDSNEIAVALIAAGFVPSNNTYDQKYMANYVTLPKTEAMQRNERTVAEFYAKVDAAYSEAKDSLYLGGADALTMLRDFQNKLAVLVQA